MIHAGKALAAAAFVLVLAACGEALADGASAAAPGGGPDIVNGIPTNLQPTTGALLFVGPDLKNEFLDCSGVLIGCRTVLTAAHCVCKTTDNYADCVSKELPTIDDADLRFFFQHSGFQHVRDIFVNPSYVRGVSGDLAILRLSEIVTGIEPSPYHQDFPLNVTDGTDGVIAGFGSSGDDRVDEAIKRVGEVTTAACPVGSGVLEPANICWNFTAPILKPGDESNLCVKDDGGPLFIDFGAGPEVAGIHAGGGASCNVDSFSYDTAVGRNRDWITEVGGPDVKRDQCSDLGEVGDPWVLVQGGEGTLPKTDTEMRFAFDVPKDEILIRATVNGETESDGDYDMFVGLNEKVPTRFDNDCQQRGVGEFGSCSFTTANVTRVNVLIRHVRPHVGKGKSRFQVTVTAWEPAPPAGNPPDAPDVLRYTKRATGFRLLSWLDESDDETGFELQRRPGTDTTASFTTRATIGANHTSILQAIPDDEVFTYRVRAFNVHGPSAWSNLCVVNKRLHRPTNLHTTLITATAVTLHWHDNADDESHYEVQRRLFGTTKWKSVATLPPNTQDFVDHGVAPGQTFEYQVRAKGFVDECIPHSRFSAILDVTTPAS
ncbi:MAG TPA: trypsin-like serine protease [Candidatus Binatia bacterium]|jgi:secreted trypsin-like serine protease